MKKILTVLLLVLTSFLISQEIAIFTKIQGEVYTELDSTKVLYKVGDMLENNSIIYSSDDSYALVHYKFTNGTLRVFPNSVVNVVSVDSLNTKVSLTKGKILNDLKEKIKGSYTVETNSTVASVRGTAFEVLLSEEGTDINVVEGKVDVLNKISKATHSLGANQRLISKNSGEIIELTPEGNPLPEVEEEPKLKDSGNGINLGLPGGIGGGGAVVLASPSLPSLPSSSKSDEKETEKDKSKEIVEEEDTKPTSSPLPIAVVLKVKGQLMLIRADKEIECSVGTILENKDVVRTDNNSLALIKFVDNSSEIRVFSNSEVLINAEKDNAKLNKNLKLEGGSILSRVNSKIVGKYSVSTTTTIASVRGTEFLVELKGGITRVIGFEGRVEVENTKSGEKSLATKGNSVTSNEDGELDRQETGEIPGEVQEELESTEYNNTMRIKFENEDGSTKTIILEY